ncbi:Dihydroxyacetone kinase 2 [Yamadazyma tenuis]|uniref:Dihydroxyacetone kinase n=1 Tax=Candida tenuis (strain ATCC 10573 / BCRC 21748 / CBS 615 / JCM 9827 / NBRC 10315 / NRRL Y-1498 / VKM Y-70) TaxID=590646 RepID=G3BA87_CANTC|nr:dihydroxyacetone kinase [Yamadazyma tenuis ATCC 10573]EGV61383.1 dihydroxyacetone kinase [Yamadazyma tenuis ATCC 10573]WEJ92599.1 Dihydroxyacetone kinase 2 [Yamadazyma tenuis]
MTLAKHWVYKPHEDIVLSHIKGLCASNPAVALIPSEKVVFNPHSDTSRKVCLISGGGAGHEPLHAGFVGTNLLDAAVSGAVFASPSTKQIMAAIKTKSDKSQGTLIIVKNYTGDILHFGLVVERAKSEGYNVEMLAVADDVAVGRKQNAMVGRRGLAGTALVHKVLGAATATTTLTLAQVVALGRAVNGAMVTVGASLDRTSVPGKTHDEIEFNGPNEAELGLGIHNEPGTKMSPIPAIDDLVRDMYAMLVSPDDEDRHYIDFDLKNDDTVLLINNIGGTSSLELYAIVQHAISGLPLSHQPQRVLVSDFVTSLNAPGFSITLLNLSSVEKNSGFSKAEILAFLDAPTDAPGWKPKSYSSWDSPSVEIESPMKEVAPVSSDLKINGSQFLQQLQNAMYTLKKAEPKITHYDTLVGDGDCGDTLVMGADGILAAAKTPEFQAASADPVAVLSRITEIVEENMGGTSGGIYSIYLTALVHQLQSLPDVSVESVGKALYKALYDGLFKYTNARVGGRTLVDTLQPFVDTLSETHNVSKALEAARAGCEKTKELQAKFGRASYVDESEFKADGGVPDPGAVGLLAIMEGFLA